MCMWQHFEGYDPEGFSMWFSDYKYPEENTVNFIVMNKVRLACLSVSALALAWLVGGHRSMACYAGHAVPFCCIIAAAYKL